MPNLAAALTDLADSQVDPADRRTPGEDDGQAEPESTLPRHCASHPSSTAFKALYSSPGGAALRGHAGLPYCQGYAAAEYVAKGHNLKFASIRLYDGGLSARILELRAARTGFAWETIFMAIRLLNVVCLAALIVFPAHSQSLPGPGQEIVAITTYLQFITEDDVDQRTKLDLLLAQKQVGREGVIRELVADSYKIVTTEGAGLLSDALVDQAFADICSRLGVAPADLMKTLEERGIRLDALRKRLRADVARERLARMPSRRHEDRLDHPLIPKM